MKLQISIEELRKHKIFIGTPMYGGNCSGSYTKSCTDLAMMCAANGIDVRFYYLFNESLIQSARNYVVDEFMRSDCTHLIFIDSDIAFDPRDVLGLIAIQVSDPKYNIVTGPYPKKTIAWEKVKKAVEIGKAEDTPFALDQYTADYVFNPINKLASFEIMAYFDCVIDPKTKRYLSEDYFFCHKARAAGMQVWMCPWMQINHIGSYIFKGNMAAIGSLGVSATADKSASKKTYKKD